MNLLPIIALAALPKHRRSTVFPIALPALAGLPVAQAGALAVITADSVARRERTAAQTEATTAVTSVLTTAVEKGATLTAEDVEHIPIARRAVATNPAILRPVGAGLSAEDLDRVKEVFEELLAQRADDGARASGGAARSSGGSGKPADGGSAPTTGKG
ncbi:hypothetical protein [Actinotalea sp. Marseille-Q4924]|uniref:hypothetical protein n=1 Tax=Actinotalea sp. Marseille-Q4924 TaxID=2866571 RepID=UPI001CE437BF|nr:hypothetical protein [Actinotalea sp. Marseille-Q4924]